MTGFSHHSGIEPAADAITAAFRDAELLRRPGGLRRADTTIPTGPHAAAPEPDRPGDASFPGFQVIREIHRGGQGVVYQAVREGTGADVAIKVLHDRSAARPREVERFQREAAALRDLNHPGIIAMSEIGVANGRPYLVMPYVAGWPLDEHVQRNDLSVRETLELFAKVCEAVNAAHLNGVIHRDLKPSNIRVDDAGGPHVLDFGLARTVDATPGLTLTEAGQFIGSLPWASPEQADAALGRPDLRTDVYSLGAVIYYLLTGAYPIDPAGSQREVLNRIVSAPPPALRTLRRGISSDVQTVVLKCLSKERERRYQNAGELARDVRHALAGEPIEARRDSAWYLFRKLLRRQRVPLALAAVFVLLLFGATIVSTTLWQQADQQRVLAERRAEETTRVADFQAKMLTGINVETMGAGMREDLLAEAERHWRASGLGDAEIGQRRGALEAQFAGVNFTTAALRSLDRNVFGDALAAIEAHFGDEPLVKARLLQHLAATLTTLGLWDRATAPQAEALAIRRRELGDAHRDTLASFRQSGRLLAWRGDYAAAEPYAREVFERHRQALGDEHADTASAAFLVGYVLQRLGALAEAENHHRLALNTRRRLLGENHSDTLTSLWALGQTLVWHGKLDEAEPLVRDYCARSPVGFPSGAVPPNANVLMGRLLEEQGQLAEAESFTRQGLESARQNFGNDHRETLYIEQRVGRLLRRQGRLDEAEPLLRSAVDGLRRIKGLADSDTVQALFELSKLLQAQGWPDEAAPPRDPGRLTEAETHLREALEGARRAPDVELDRPLNIASKLAAVLDALGKTVDAADVRTALVRETLADFREWTGDGTYPRFRAPFYLLIRKIDDGGELQRAFIDAHREKYGAGHANTLNALNTLAWHLAQVGNATAAEPLAREAVEGFRTLPAPNQYLLMALDTLATILRDTGRLEAAAALYEEEKRAGQALLGELGPRDPDVCVHHAECLMRLNRFTDAERELLECHDALAAAATPDDDALRAVIEALIRAYEGWHAAEPAGGHEVSAGEWRARLEVRALPGG